MAETECKREQEWTTVIKPRTSLFDIDLKELWRFRDLYTIFVSRDIKTQYKQTILGPLWFLIQPVLTTVMYMVVFGGIAGISTDGLPQALFYLAGICLWQYFAQCLNATSSTFISNAAIFGRSIFPVLLFLYRLLPLSWCVSASSCSCLCVSICTMCCLQIRVWHRTCMLCYFRC